MSCNCSHCAQKGLLWFFPGKAEAIEIERGENKLKDYTFGSGKLIHKVMSLSCAWNDDELAG